MTNETKTKTVEITDAQSAAIIKTLEDLKRAARRMVRAESGETSEDRNLAHTFREVLGEDEPLTNALFALNNAIEKFQILERRSWYWVR